MDNNSKLNLKYIGNGPYCFANSTAMLLASIGEEVPPSLIEVLSGVGLGATFYEELGLLFFSHPNLMPDLGIGKALEILGFSYISKASKNEEDFPPEELKKDLARMPAIVGPLDMGYLIYNPDHKCLRGVDHFVLVYAVQGKNVYLHDPAGFPNVYLDIENFKKSWKAEKILYRRGYYRYITSVRRIKKRNRDEIYKDALYYFKLIYQKAKKSKRLNGPEAILSYAKKIGKGKITQGEKEHFIYFALPLAARRALDFGSFFSFENKKLANLKFLQSRLFGKAHVLTLKQKWVPLAKTFQELAKTEEALGAELLNLEGENHKLS